MTSTVMGIVTVVELLIISGLCLAMQVSVRRRK
jgi:hypothetical protein